MTPAERIEAIRKKLEGPRPGPLGLAKFWDEEAFFLLTCVERLEAALNKIKEFHTPYICGDGSMVPGKCEIGCPGHIAEEALSPEA